MSTGVNENIPKMCWTNLKAQAHAANCQIAVKIASCLQPSIEAKSSRVIAGGSVFIFSAAHLEITRMYRLGLTTRPGETEDLLIRI